MMNGVYNIVKPPGMTSHDVVAAVRRIARMKRVGHTGTLDPGAVGVLPVCVGLATRLADYITDERKSYRAEVTLGTETDSGDSFGKILTQSVNQKVSREQVEDACQSFLGNITQIPPMTSAIKVGGKKLYELAHQGIEIERPVRHVVIYNLQVVKWDLDFFPQRFLLDVECSKGTYIRSLCTDLGRALGCGAFMSFLVRTKVGNFALHNAISIEELRRCAEEACLDQRLIPMEQAVGRLPSLELSINQAEAIRHGRAFSVEIGKTFEAGAEIQLTFHHKLVAIAQLTSSADPEILMVKPIKVFHL